MGKPSDILNMLPGATELMRKKGDCWGSFGMTHKQTPESIILTNQRVLFRGGGLIESLRLVFAIPYHEIARIEPYTVSLLFPTGIRIVSRRKGAFRLSVTKRNGMMEIIRSHMAGGNGVG